MSRSTTSTSNNKRSTEGSLSPNHSVNHTVFTADPKSAFLLLFHTLKLIELSQRTGSCVHTKLRFAKECKDKDAQKLDAIDRDVSSWDGRCRSEMRTNAIDTQSQRLLEVVVDQ